MQRLLLMVLLLMTALGVGCESDYQSRQRAAESMNPSDLEQLSEQDLQQVCYYYLDYADAATTARSLEWSARLGWFAVDQKIFDTLYPLSDPNEILAECDDLDAFVDRLAAGFDEARDACGPCFGVGSRGESISRAYSKASAEIPQWRATIQEHRERAVEIANQRALTRAWKQSNLNLLMYKGRQVSIEITDIRVIGEQLYRSATTEVYLKLTALEEGKILWPCNHKIWGYDVHPDLGGSHPIGASLRDDLGNTLPLRSFEPSYLGRSDGLHCGDSRDFTLVFSEYPVENAASVTLQFMPGVFGQDATINIALAMEVFLKDHESIAEIMPSH